MSFLEKVKIYLLHSVVGALVM